MSLLVHDWWENIFALENKLKERFWVVLRVWQVKKRDKLDSIDSSRWNSVLLRIVNKAREQWLDEDCIRTYWNSIHDISVQMEEKIKCRNEKTVTYDTLDVLRWEIDTVDEQIIYILRIIASQNKWDKFRVVITWILENVKQTLWI